MKEYAEATEKHAEFAEMILHCFAYSSKPW